MTKVYFLKGVCFADNRLIRKLYSDGMVASLESVKHEDYRAMRNDAYHLLAYALYDNGVCAPFDVLRSPSGKPYLESGPHFSVSHCEGLSVVAVSDDECGVDCERKDRNVDFLKVADSFFHPSDVLMIRASDDNPREVFLRIWNAKESVFKMTGDGIKRELMKSFFVDELEEHYGCVISYHETDLHFIAASSKHPAQFEECSVKKIKESLSRFSS